MSYPFRIEPRSGIQLDTAGRPDAALTQRVQDYTDRLIRLIPAEIIGIYLTVRGFWMPDTKSTPPARFLNWWPLLCAALLVVSRVWGTRALGGNLQTIQVRAISIAVISFFIWVFSIGDPVFGLNPDPRLVSTLLVLWVFLIPTVYYGNAPEK